MTAENQDHRSAISLPSAFATRSVTEASAFLREQLLAVIRQHMPAAEALADVPFHPEDVVIQWVGRSLGSYHAACRAGAAPDYSGA